MLPGTNQLLPSLFAWRSSPGGAHGAVNSYIIRTMGSSAILIDPADDLRAASLEPLEITQVTAILITHTHRENVAGARNFPDAKLYVPAGDEYLYNGIESYRSMITPWPSPWEWESRGCYVGHLGGAANERPPERPLVVSGSLRGGDHLLDFDILPAPGHTKNAVALIGTINGHRVAFTGDLIHVGGTLWNYFDCDWDYGTGRGLAAVIQSARRVAACRPRMIFPSHGEMIDDVPADTQRLTTRIQAVLQPLASDEWDSTPHIQPATQTAAAGWWELLPSLYQWRDNAGNANLLVSRSGQALMVDDGLCSWLPLHERQQHHHRAIEDAKAKLGITAIEMVIPTHYHGDHIENIPDLVRTESTQVLTLDLTGGPIERPEDFNLACALPWYGTRYPSVRVDRAVTAGTVVRWREFDLQLFHLPSQTYFHAGIQTTIAGRRVIFAGDALGGHTPECGAVLSYNDAEPAERGWAAGVRILRERKADLIVCGHGIAVRDPEPLLAALAQNWSRRLDQFRQLNARSDNQLFFNPYFAPASR